MSAAHATVDLDDTRALLEADRDGLLRHAAMAGAQVRSTAAAVEEGALESVAADHRPRSVIWLARRGPAREYLGCGPREDLRAVPVTEGADEGDHELVRRDPEAPPQLGDAARVESAWIEDRGIDAVRVPAHALLRDAPRE
jgi:hypothetical protein